ncbi:MAG: hypothetical protein IPJ39_01900 [Saprospiraceae bacterium]|nr:hypothetical protein [Saprospiraceae bacterium]
MRLVQIGRPFIFWREGDVYTYDVENDLLTYHVDVTPGNANFYGTTFIKRIKSISSMILYIISVEPLSVF